METTTLIFDSVARDQVEHLETAVNLCASVRQVNNFFHSFELGGITIHLLTGPAGNTEVCFPSTINVPEVEIDGLDSALGLSHFIKVYNLKFH